MREPTHGNWIFLEVRESNQSARRLYSTLGFEETGLRKSYYSNPPDRCNTVSPKALLALSHNETAPEFGIEPVLVLW